MEEITRIAKEYLYTTINYKYFDVPSAFLLFFCTGIAAGVIYLVATNHWLVNTPVMIIFMVIWGLFIKKIKYRYEIKLIKHLSYLISESKIDDVKLLKARYLRKLTINIGSNNYEALKNINYLKEQLDSNRPLIMDNFGYYFGRFLYSSEAKPRILSLFIFLLSILFLLMVTKSDFKTNPTEIVQYITSDFYSYVLTWGIFSVLFVFWIGYTLISFINLVIIRPMSLINANNNFAVNYLVSDLARYSFLETTDTGDDVNNEHQGCVSDKQVL